MQKSRTTISFRFYNPNKLYIEKRKNVDSYEYVLEVGRNNIDFDNKIIEAHERYRSFKNSR